MGASSTRPRHWLETAGAEVLEGDFLEGDTVVVNGGTDALTFTKQEPVKA